MCRAPRTPTRGSAGILRAGPAQKVPIDALGTEVYSDFAARLGPGTSGVKRLAGRLDLTLRHDVAQYGGPNKPIGLPGSGPSPTTSPSGTQRDEARWDPAAQQRHSLLGEGLDS